MALPPLFHVTGEGGFVTNDVGSGLLEGQGELAEFDGQDAGLGGVVGLRAAAALLVAPAFGTLQEKSGCGFDGENVEGEGVDGALPIAEARGDDDLASAGEAGEKGLHGDGGFLGIDVVEDEEPAGMSLQPIEDRGYLHLGLAGILFGEIQNHGTTERGQVRLQAGGGIGLDEEQRGVLVGIAVGVFEGSAGFADSAQAVDGGRSGSGGDGGDALVAEVLGCAQGVVQLGEKILAAFEEGAEAFVGKVVDFEIGFEVEVEEDAADKFGVAEEGFVMLAAGFDAGAVIALELGVGFGLLDGGAAVARGGFGGDLAEDGAGEAHRQVVLPLRVGELRQRVGRGEVEVGEEGADVFV